jgi:hypothetical protein
MPQNNRIYVYFRVGQLCIVTLRNTKLKDITEAMLLLEPVTFPMLWSSLAVRIQWFK